LQRNLVLGLVATLVPWQAAAQPAASPAATAPGATATPANALASVPAAATRPCSRAARLSGEAATVAHVSAILDERGVATGVVEGCATIAVRLDRSGDGAITIAIDGRDSRTVGDVATAATVIESWVRTDVEAPLLATRTIAAAPALVVAAAPPPPTGHTIQWFSLAETGVATDRTSWFNVQLGACIRLGPICAAARVRIGGVIDGPGMWEHGLDRRDVELLVGGDIPLAVGNWTVSPGFGGGVGTVFTRLHDMEGKMGAEVGGLRADAHVTAAYPLTKKLALEVDVSAALTQATHIESFSPMPLPDVPTALFRFGAGLRYGGL
jgi:hypothetical protein